MIKLLNLYSHHLIEKYPISQNRLKMPIEGTFPGKQNSDYQTSLKLTLQMSTQTEILNMD